MQKFFDVRFPRGEDYEALKTLWQTAFDDSREALDFFFENTVSTERTLAAFEGSTPVSAMYMLEGEIAFGEKSYSAYYIYGVCTHPLYRGRGLMTRLFEQMFEIVRERQINYVFLVPENEKLFTLYEKSGFKTGFFYSQKEVTRNELSVRGAESSAVFSERITYSQYRKAVFSENINVPVALLKESTFKSFFNPFGGEIKIMFNENTGYVLFEETDEQLTVFELFGDEERLLAAVFQNTSKDSILYRQKANENPYPYGMYRKFGDVPEINNGFFGICYST